MKSSTPAGPPRPVFKPSKLWLSEDQEEFILRTLVQLQNLEFIRPQQAGEASAQPRRAKPKRVKLRALDMEAAALAVALGPYLPQSQRSLDELEELSAELSAFDASADEGRTLQGAPSSCSSCPGKTDGDLPVNCHDL